MSHQTGIKGKTTHKNATVPWLICWARDFFRHWFVLIAKENPVYRCVRVIIAAEIKWPQSRKTEEKKLLLKRATTTTTTTAAAIIFLYFTLLAIFRFGYERVLFRAINREFYRTRDVCTCCYIQFLPFFLYFFVFLFHLIFCFIITVSFICSRCDIYKWDKYKYIKRQERKKRHTDDHRIVWVSPHRESVFFFIYSFFFVAILAPILHTLNKT